MLAAKLVKAKYTASAQLLRYETPGVSDFLKSDSPISSDTFAGLLRAPELLRQTGEKAVPQFPPRFSPNNLRWTRATNRIGRWSLLINHSRAATGR